MIRIIVKKNTNRNIKKIQQISIYAFVEFIKS
jgi:hypothetical protein